VLRRIAGLIKGWSGVDVVDVGRNAAGGHVRGGTVDDS
jgi:hypothetical protein